MAETLEDKVANGTEKKEPKLHSRTESASAEIKEGGRVVANASIGTGALGVSTLLGGYDWLATAGTFLLGGFLEKKLAKKPEPFTSKDFVRESAAGTTFAPFPWLTFETIKQIPQAYGIDGVVNALGYAIPASAIAIGGLALATIPLLNISYYLVKHVFDNGSFKGVGKEFKSGGEYWKGTKRSMIYLGLPTAATVAAFATVPWLAPWFYPAFGALSVAYRLALSKKDVDYKKLAKGVAFSPYYAAKYTVKGAAYTLQGAASVTQKASKGITEFAYALGSSIDKLISPSKAPSAGPTPAPAPA